MTVRRLFAALALGAACSLLFAGAAAAAPELVRPPSADIAPAGFSLTAHEAIAIGDRREEVVRQRRSHPGLTPTAFTAGPGRWQLSYFAGGKERVQVIVSDRLRVATEAWTGTQIAWRMSRGYEGAFGQKFNAPYLLIPLGLLFLLPFLDPRRPFRMLHLDLLVMLAFGISHLYFNQGRIGVSAPLVYPVLLYLLARMLWIGIRPREQRGPLVPWAPAKLLAVGLVFLVVFRIGLNVADSNVIDVGYAGVIGADMIADGEGLYDGNFPKNNARGDTYGPVNYLAYLPWEQVLPWSGAWDELPAARAAAITFDLLTMIGLFLLGGRLRRERSQGRLLGLALAFAWAAYPYSLFVVTTNANDSLVAALVVFAVLAATSAPARGALAALAGATKIAPLALAPLLMVGAGEGRRVRGMAVASLCFVAVFALCVVPFIPDGGLSALYDRTVGFQADRDSPFSLWGQVSSLGWLHTAVKVAVVALAVAVAFVPRGRRTVPQVAALGAAVLIAVQLTATHWFYLYIVWFAPLVLVALFARQRTGVEKPMAPELDSETPLAPAPEPVLVG